VVNQLRDALSAVNQSSALEWAAQFPRLSVVELARQLSGRVEPIALQQEMVREAREQGTFPELARGLLVRLLLRDFPRGLGQSAPEEAKSALASIFSIWMLIFDPDQRTAAEAIWAKVVNELETHPNWAPEPGDARLAKLFAGHDLNRSKRAALVAAARERIEVCLQGLATNKRWLEALTQLPPGHGLLHAASWVDAEVRNGGFAQLYKNSGGVEVPLAITALHAMGRAELAVLVQESLINARLNHRHLLASELTHAPVLPENASPRSWTQLENAYYPLARDLFEAYASLIESKPELFNPTYRTLRHSDGRTWRIRTSGAAIELEIGLEDGTSINRLRQCATAERAEQEMKSMLEEQLADGFVEAPARAGSRN
jgi:hypothetical protein